MIKDLQLSGGTIGSGKIDFGSCQNLRALYWHRRDEIPNESVFHTFNFTDVQFETLRHIDLSASIPDIYCILSRFPNLVECTWYLWRDDDRHWTQRDPTLVLPNLETLDIDNSHQLISISPLFDALCLPNLLALSVSIVNLVALHNMVLRSSPPLYFLNLDFLPSVSSDDLIETLYCLPTLAVTTL